MKPRRPPQSTPAPEKLCRYIRAEWPGEPDPFRAWCEARLAFIREHGMDTVLGDVIDVLREHRRLKIEMSWTAKIQPAQFSETEQDDD